MGGLLLPLTPYPCLQTPPNPTSCHDQVVLRVMPLDLHAPLEAQMVCSQAGCPRSCMVVTGTRCSRRVISLWMLVGRCHWIIGEVVLHVVCVCTPNTFVNSPNFAFYMKKNSV